MPTSSSPRPRDLFLKVKTNEPINEKLSWCFLVNTSLLFFIDFQTKQISKHNVLVLPVFLNKDEWNHRVCIHVLVVFAQWYVWYLWMLLLVAVVYSFSCAVQKSIVWVYPNRWSVFIHCIADGPLDDPFGGVMDKVAVIIFLSCFFACGYAFLLGLYPGEELLAHRLCVSSTSVDNTKLSSRVHVPVYFLQQHMGILAPYPCQHCQSL